MYYCGGVSLSRRLGTMAPMDERLRHLERQANAGDPIARGRLLTERLRIGVTSRARLQLARAMGHAPAALALDEPVLDPLAETGMVLVRKGRGKTHEAVLMQNGFRSRCGKNLDASSRFLGELAPPEDAREVPAGVTCGSCKNVRDAGCQIVLRDLARDAQVSCGDLPALWRCRLLVTQAQVKTWTHYHVRACRNNRENCCAQPFRELARAWAHLVEGTGESRSRHGRTAGYRSAVYRGDAAARLLVPAVPSMGPAVAEGSIDYEAQTFDVTFGGPPVPPEPDWRIDHQALPPDWLPDSRSVLTLLYVELLPWLAGESEDPAPRLARAALADATNTIKVPPPLRDTGQTMRSIQRRGRTSVVYPGRVPPRPGGVHPMFAGIHETGSQPAPRAYVPPPLDHHPPSDDEPF